MEVGSGVHPELTGRENIWLYGQILGMTKADIRRRFDEIVEFSELGGAIDTPVKFFSSGMQLRLGSRSLHTLSPTSSSSTRLLPSVMRGSNFAAFGG